MKRTCVLLIALLAGLSVSAGGFVFPPGYPQPYHYFAFPVEQAWYDAEPAWIYCSSTSDFNYARWQTLHFSPKLASALTPRVPGGDIAARPMYVVTNRQNLPVLSARPGDPLYSALWQVFYVTWKPGVTPRPITSADPASPTNPTGLPSAAEATIVPSNVVLDCTVLVLGPLACPGARNAPGYLIPQATATSAGFRLKTVTIPTWLTDGQFLVNQRVGSALTLITDASDPALANALGANLAPGLLNLPDSDTTNFYVWRGPKPPTQLPVIGDYPLSVGSRPNPDFSPVMRYIIMQRLIPPSTVIQSREYIELLLNNGLLIILRDDQRINAPTFIS